jgi:hypothetical protein
MNFIRIKILAVMFFAASCLNAQYSEQIQFSSIDYFLMNNIIFKDVYKKDNELMKSSIKKVTVTDERNNILSETNIDAEGRVTGYKSNSVSGEPQNIKGGYDIKNNLTGIVYRNTDGKVTEHIRLNYIGTAFFSYEKYENGNELFEQCEMRYDNEKDKSLLTGFDSHLWQGDSIPYSVNFKYDIYNRLNDVRVTGDVTPLYEISYSGDTIKIKSASGYESYIVKDNIITGHTIHSEELNYTASRIFTYDENGLVKFISIEDMLGNKYRQNYSYDYYH